MTQLSKKHPRWFSQGLFALSLLFLLFGLLNLGWVVWPAPVDAVEIIIPEGVLPGTPQGKDFASLSTYRLQVSWPRWMRSGSVGKIHAVLTDMDDPASLIPEQDVQVTLIEPVIPGLLVSPAGQAQAGLADQQALALSWEVQAKEADEYPGKMTVSFGFFDTEIDELQPVPVAVVDLHIKVIDLWGLAPGMAIWFGMVSLVFWGGLLITGRMVQGEKKIG
jgi:hypothetical protein